MSKADKMFRDLGYRKEVTDKYVRYSNGIDGKIEEFIFVLRHKKVSLYRYGSNDIVQNSGTISAVHEKMKELGWINEL